MPIRARVPIVPEGRGWGGLIEGEEADVEREIYMWGEEAERIIRQFVNVQTVYEAGGDEGCGGEWVRLQGERDLL